MGKSRPWKDHARIERVELNNGDVKFTTWATAKVVSPADCEAAHRTFEDLTSAETHLSEWWSEFWPRQPRKATRA